MSNYKDTQIIQLENEELRIRLKDLTAQLGIVKTQINEYENQKYPSKTYHLERTIVGGKSQYTIVDERGYFEDNFFCDDVQNAIVFFNTYIKEKKPTKKAVLASGIMGGVYTSLVHLECQYISGINELKLVSTKGYMVYVGKDCIKSLPMETTEQDALVLYKQELDKYFAENSTAQPPKEIIA